MENSLHYTSVNHAYHLVDSINQLRKQEELCDIILNCGEIKIPAHKLILSVSTPYFKSLVENKYKDSNQGEIRIDGLDGTAVQNIIEFFYTSAVSVDDITVWTLLPAACLLQVEEIQNLCCDFLSSQLQVENCLKVHRVAAKCLCSGLVKETTDFICKNFMQIVDEEAFLDLSVRDVVGHLQRLKEMGVEKDKVLQALKCWVIYSVDDRQMLGYKLLQEFPELKEELENFIPTEYQVQQEDDDVEMENFSAPSPQPSVSVVTMETNTPLPKLDNLNPLMCFECSEVLPSTEELKKHVQTHINSMFKKSAESQDESRSSYDMPSFDKLIKEQLENSKKIINSSSPESSYFDTYMKARGLDNLSFGGLKREREFTKSPSMQGNVKEITVTVTSTPGDGQELKFICPICGQTCPSTEELGKHIEQHSGFSCTICGRSYSTKGNLQTHMKKHNNGENTLLKCPFCDKSFISQAVLKVHMRSHTGEKPFTCDTCGVAFTKNIHLKRHLAIHTGVKPHQCEICQKRFSRSDHLKRHVQSIHTQNRPHLCSLCGKDFVRKYELNKHMKQMHWGFTVGQNGTSSTETSLHEPDPTSSDQKEPDVVFDSEVNQNMHKLIGAFIVGDNNNEDDGGGDEEGDGRGDTSVAQSEDSGLVDESLAQSEETESSINNHVN